jgi:antitoxin component of RelBE/YafQ-DinJ toxin-antitoxin module
MTQVIYARTPEKVKAAADAYASERGMTLTGAVVDLLERGLSAASDEQSIAELQANLARANAEKAQVEASLKASASEAAALKAFAQRAATSVGRCPNGTCEQPITGYDLLGIGKCPNCQQQLTSLLAPEGQSPSLDQRELLPLLGALGAVLALAYLTSS